MSKEAKFEFLFDTISKLVKTEQQVSMKKLKKKLFEVYNGRRNFKKEVDWDVFVAVMEYILYTQRVLLRPPASRWSWLKGLFS